MSLDRRHFRRAGDVELEDVLWERGYDEDSSKCRGECLIDNLPLDMRDSHCLASPPDLASRESRRMRIQCHLDIYGTHL